MSTEFDLYSARKGDPPAIAALRAVLRRDENKQCPWCPRFGWDVPEDPHPHDNDCPFQAVINVLKDYETEEIQ